MTLWVISWLRLKGEGGFVGETLNLWQGYYINQPLLKWEIQIRRYLYCTSLWFSLVVYQWFNRSVRQKAKLASPLHNGLIAFQNFFDSIAKTKRKKKKNKFVTPEKGACHEISTKAQILILKTWKTDKKLCLIIFLQRKSTILLDFKDIQRILTVWGAGAGKISWKSPRLFL